MGGGYMGWGLGEIYGVGCVGLGVEWDIWGGIYGVGCGGICGVGYMGWDIWGEIYGVGCVWGSVGQEAMGGVWGEIYGVDVWGDAVFSLQDGNGNQVLPRASQEVRGALWGPQWGTVGQSVIFPPLPTGGQSAPE